MQGRGMFAMMARPLAWLLMWCASLHVMNAAEAPLGTQFTPQQKVELSSGKPLVIEENVPGEAWPLLTICQQIACPPVVLAGVFWDSELDSEYLPGCRSVRILARPDNAVQEAQFTLKMPFFLADEVSVSLIELFPQPPGTYKIVWRMIESRYAKSGNGSIVIEPHGGGTFIRYRTFTAPHSKIAVLMRSSASERVVENVEAMVNQVRREILLSPGLIRSQQRELDRAMGK